MTSTSNFMHLDSLMTYCLLLNEEKAYGLCNYSYTSFALQDFDKTKSKLKVKPI